MEQIELVDSREYFDVIRGYKKIILIGCGGKGRQAIKLLENLDIHISAACDNNKKIQGKYFYDSVLIQSLDDVLKDVKSTDTCILLTCSINYAIEMEQELKRRCPDISVYHLCNPFKIEQTLVSSVEVEENRELLTRQATWLGDKESQNIFRDTLNSKITGNMLPLLKYSTGNAIYTFFDEHFIPIDEKNVYMDIGAYTGDTIASFMMYCRGTFKRIVGVEADKGNYASLQKFVQCSRVPNVEIYNIGLWSHEEEREFYTNAQNDEINYDSPNLFQNVDKMADNLSLNKIDGNLACEVIHLKTLDEISKEVSPNIIKVNALAADRQIIMGGRKYIAENKPILIFEFGVTKKDVFEMLSIIKEMNPDYTFYFRRKKVFGDIKTVVYGV